MTGISLSRSKEHFTGEYADPSTCTYYAYECIYCQKFLLDKALRPLSPHQVALSNTRIICDLILDSCIKYLQLLDRVIIIG